jgi:RNA polymerase sigma-70 factor (ECF subfamily)
VPPQGSGCVLRAWNTYQAELLGWLRRQLPDAPTARDVLQDTFVKALREGQGFCRLDDPRAWLFRVARNAVTDRHRLWRPHETIDDHADALAQSELPATEPLDALAGCLERVLAELPAEDAAVVRACDLDGQAQKDFALAHGLSLAATKSRLLRARRRLREQLTRACRVQFDPADGRVCGHLGRAASVQEAPP